MREAIAAVGGREVQVAGDSFFVVFDRALDAVERAALGQRGLAAARWPEGGRPRVRIGIQTGEPTPADGDFVGMDVHGAARVMAVAHGGKVLLSGDTGLAVGSDAQLVDLGYHRLKDPPEPEHLFQLVADGLECRFPQAAAGGIPTGESRSRDRIVLHPLAQAAVSCRLRQRRSSFDSAARLRLREGPTVMRDAELFCATPR